LRSTLKLSLYLEPPQALLLIALAWNTVERVAADYIALRLAETRLNPVMLSPWRIMELIPAQTETRSLACRMKEFFRQP
jgi:hypothetical protein